MFELFARIIADNVGSCLSLENDSALPERCAICNIPVQTPPRRLRIKASALGAEPACITIYVHLCARHARRRKVVRAVALAIAMICGVLAGLARPEGKTMPTWSVIAFGGSIASSLVLINSFLHDPYFRGLSMENGKMEIKGFGKRFIQSLKGEEILPHRNP